jgi:hypothetical protein
MTADNGYEVSKAALRPLLDMHWSSQGWRDPLLVPVEEDMRRAVDAGVMFTQPWTVDHDGLVETARSVASQVSIEDVSRAFVASLSSRRLDLRSALGSFAVARLLPEHRWTPAPGRQGCAVCGLKSARREEDINILNFERFKWGGVRRDDIAYVVFDLQQFQRAPKLQPTEADIALGRDLIAALRTAPSKMTGAQAQGRIAMLKSNKSERDTLIDILGVCSILETPDHQGYYSQFTPVSERVLPEYRFVERTYPVCWWRGANGINDAALALFIPQLL